MIRKAGIVILTLAAAITLAVWGVSYAVATNEAGDGTVGYSYGRDWSFPLPDDPQGQSLNVGVERGTLHVRYWDLDETSATRPAKRSWRRLGFAFYSGPYTGRQPPYGFCLAEIPLWCPFVVFTVFPAVALYRGPLRRHRRRRRGLCVRCGYDLTGNTSGRCPECDTEIERP